MATLNLAKIGLVGFYHSVDYVAAIEKGLLNLSYSVAFFPLYKVAQDENERIVNYLQVLLEWIQKENIDVIIWFYTCLSRDFFKRNLGSKSILHIYYNPEDRSAPESEFGSLVGHMNHVLTEHEEIMGTPSLSTCIKVASVWGEERTPRGAVVVFGSSDSALTQSFCSIDRFAPIIVNTDDACVVVEALKTLSSVQGVIYTGQDSLLKNEELLHTFLAATHPAAWYCSRNIDESNHSPTYARTIKWVQSQLLSDRGPMSIVETVDQLTLSHVLDRKFLAERTSDLTVDMMIKNKVNLRCFLSQLLLPPRRIVGPFDVESYCFVNKLDARMFMFGEDSAKAHWLFLGKKAGFVICLPAGSNANLSVAGDRDLDTMMYVDIELMQCFSLLRADPDKSQIIERKFGSVPLDVFFKHLNVYNKIYFQFPSLSALASSSSSCEKREKTNAAHQHVHVVPKKVVVKAAQQNSLAVQKTLVSAKEDKASKRPSAVSKRTQLSSRAKRHVKKRSARFGSGASQPRS
jgi:hypothetical protein